MSKHLLRSLVLSCLCISQLAAQSLVEREWIALHARGGLGYNSHSTTITSFEGVSDCGLFDHGSSFRPQFSLSLETPVAHTFCLGLSARSTDRSASIYSNNTVLPSADISKPGSVLEVTFENSIACTLPYIDVIPELRYDFSQIGKSHQRLSVGLIAAFAMQPTFNQEQRIVSPENVVYTINNKQTVSLSNGTKPIGSISNMLFGLCFGIENLLPIGKSSYFTQQLTVESMFNNVVSSAPWKTMAVRADLGFRFSLQSAEPIPVIPPAKPSPVKKDSIPPIVKTVESAKPLPILTARLENVSPYLQTGSELRASASLVNAVFFEQNSAEIPERYYTSKDRVVESDNAFEHHRSILFSVANIMKNNPKASIVLEGATSGNDEAGAIGLAKQRAEAVQAALAKLGIEPDRMSVRATILPHIASNADYAQGREENRRVDINVQNAPLQEYVSRQQFVQLRGSAQIAIDAQFFDSSEINVQSPAMKDQVFRGTEQRVVELNQRLSTDKGNYTLEISAHAPPFLNSRDEYQVNLSDLRREQIVLNLQSFDAILRFDYNSAEFSQANKELLRQLVTMLPEGSTIQILGSADALGDEASNRQLSERRAANTESFIKSISSSKFRLESSVSTDKFDESRPEGRFLNRSIRIRVRE